MNFYKQCKEKPFAGVEIRGFFCFPLRKKKKKMFLEH